MRCARLASRCSANWLRPAGRLNSAPTSSGACPHCPAVQFTPLRLHLSPFTTSARPHAWPLRSAVAPCFRRLDSFPQLFDTMGAYLFTTCESPLPSDAVLCDGMPQDYYCDCSGDCTGRPELCACGAAQACCAAHFIDILSPQPGHSPGPFHSPPPWHSPGPFHSPEPMHSPGPFHSPPP